MTERGILFSGPMVRAILAGLKTQTRRPVKLEKAGCGEGLICRGGRYIEMSADGPVWMPYGGSPRVPCPLDVVQRYCPYGVPGDRLWVRETLTILDWDEHLGACVQYAADEVVRGWTHDEHGVPLTWGRNKKTVPSIHMPRWASRITLEVTDVRVERVQSITEEDAMAEGIEPITCQDDTMAQRFRQSWQRTYPGSWERNDWVWCVSFRRLA